MPYYTLTLLNDPVNSFKHVISILMLISFDYEHAKEVAILTHEFGKEVIAVSLLRVDIELLADLLKDNDLYVMMESISGY